MYLIQRKKVIDDTFTSFYKQRETTPPSNDKLGALPYAYVFSTEPWKITSVVPVSKRSTYI